MKIPNFPVEPLVPLVSLARIVSEDSQPKVYGTGETGKSSKDS